MPNHLLNALGFVKALAHKRGIRNLAKKGKGITGLNAVKRIEESERSMEGEGMKKKRQVLKFKM
jgi:hypothetical protein